MSNIIMSTEFMAKAKAAKSFEELKSMVAAEGIEVAEDELMAKWEEFSSQGSAKKFKLSEEELDNVAGGCGDNATRWKCTSCDRTYYWNGIWDESDAPNCDYCGAPMEFVYHFEL